MHLFDKLEDYSSNVAIIDDNQNSYTYKELLHSADNLGKKISKRTTVFLVCKNMFCNCMNYLTAVFREVFPSGPRDAHRELAQGVLISYRYTLKVNNHYCEH